jgi:hypothetical protein
MINRIKLAIEARLLSNQAFVRKQFLRKTGKTLNLDHPELFSEKLQWLKLNYRNPLLPKLVDKYEAKKFIDKAVGIEFVIPTHSIFENANDIKVKNLPEKYALKATHGSGWNLICNSGNCYCEEYIHEYFNKWLRKSFYTYSKEWAYKDIKPRVICEELLLDSNNNLPLDYKVYCFNGQPEFILTVRRSPNGKSTHTFFDKDWKMAPFGKNKKQIDYNVPKPKHLKKMLELSAKLSQDFPFLRVDFFYINENIFIGELTFYPDSGMSLFQPIEWEKKLGQLLNLPK